MDRELERAGASPGDVADIGEVRLDSGARMALERWKRPSPAQLALLARYDHDAFGETGLRPFDMGVVATAGALYVVPQGDDIAACCQLMRMFDDPGLFWVVGFWVRPRWQGRGLGRAVLTEILAGLDAAGGRGLELTVSPDNRRARGLYADMGFREIEDLPGFYGPGEDRIRLRFDPCSDPCPSEPRPVPGASE